MKGNFWLAALALTAWSGAASAESLLIVHADTDPPVAELSGGFFDVVDTFDAGADTPTLGELTPFDAVLAYTNFIPLDAVALGDVLADYVDAGGRVGSGPVLDRTGWAEQEPGGHLPVPGRCQAAAEIRHKGPSARAACGSGRATRSAAR